MQRTSPVHYIAPSAISITPNANGSANDFAVYIAAGTKIKVYSYGISQLDMVNATWQEWSLSGRNRRLSSDAPHTLYARLSKSDYNSGYLVFAPKVQEDNVWKDKYPYVTWLGLATDTANYSTENYWYIKLGEVSAPEAGVRTLDLDTGILGTDQYNSEWIVNPDNLPLRIEIDCRIGGEGVGSYPYVSWGQEVELSAHLMEGFVAAADTSMIDHFSITRIIEESTSSASSSDENEEEWPDAVREAAFRTTGEITLLHDREAGDDFLGAEAVMFTVTAWGEPDEDDSPSSGGLVAKAVATITIHAETYGVVTSDDIPDTLDDFTPDDNTIMTGAAMDAYLALLAGNFLRRDLPDESQNVEGDVEFEKDVEIGNDASIAGDASISGNTTVAQDLAVGNDASIAGGTTFGSYILPVENGAAGNGAKVFSDGRVHAFGKDATLSEEFGGSRFKTVMFGIFKPGLITGAESGAVIYEDGMAKFRAVAISEFLEVPEIRFNRATVYVGIGIRSVGGGIMEEVIPDTDANGNLLPSGRAALKLEDGEYGAIDFYDLCLGFWHNENNSRQGIDNATADYDGKNGDYELQGFQSVYFRIDHIFPDKEAYDQNDTTPSQSTGANKYFHYTLRGTASGSSSSSSTTGSKNWNKHPKPQMHFGQIANPNNTDRQSIIITTTEYELKLKDMTWWNYTSQNIRSIDGKLDGFSMTENYYNKETGQYEQVTRAFSGNGIVLGNAYIYGKLDQFERAEYKVNIDVNGDYLIDYGETKEIVCTLINGYGEDITHTVTAWAIIRDTGRTTQDTAWNLSTKAQAFDGNITLAWNDTEDDLADHDESVLSAIFRIEATHSGGTTSQTIQL